MKSRIGQLTAIGTACVAAMALAACVGTGTGPDTGSAGMTSTSAKSATLSCEQLLGMAVPAGSIGLPTSGAMVTSANLVAASGSGATAIPAYCEVSGRISPVDVTAPNILFQVGLPVNWNRKAVMFGGGGFNGTIPGVRSNVPAGPVDRPTPLGQGYATFASDSGHQSNGLGSRDGLFGLHDEALRNYGGDALKKTRDTAAAIIKAHYGTSPVKSYFAGGSNGGREALTIIQRWPADWDGAIAWYPAWNDVGALLGGHHLSRALAQPGAYPNAAKRLVLYEAAMESCDGLDGVVDGLISNQKACNARFDPSTATLRGAPVRCAGGADTGDSCLSDAQIRAMKTINGPLDFRLPMANGDTSYPGYNVWGADTGIASWKSPVQPYVTFVNFGASQPARPMPANAPYMSVLTDQWLRYFVARDPKFDALAFDPAAPGAWANRLQEISALLDASTDISAFKARGGKLLLAHGLVDVVVSSRATEQYYQRLQSQMGAAQVDTFVRFYEVAGYGHAGSSVFNASWDSLTAIDRWSVDGTAPERQIVTDAVGVPGRTRPLCDYPKWPKYASGNVDQAASFRCAE